MTRCLPGLVVGLDLLGKGSPRGVADRSEDRRTPLADRWKGVGSAGGDTGRRGWVLVGLGDHRDVLEAVIGAVIRGARLGPGSLDDVENFAKALTALGIRHAVGLVGLGYPATAEISRPWLSRSTVAASSASRNGWHNGNT